jgi:hypothetical protein
MGTDFRVTVMGERGDEFKDVFGTNTVHVLLPYPIMAKLEGLDEPELVYMLDADLLTAEQRDRLVWHLARKFMSSEIEVNRFLDMEGLPIRAADTVVTIDHPQRWMLDDMPGAAELEKLDVMSDLDDTDEFDALDSYDDGYA